LDSNREMYPLTHSRGAGLRAVHPQGMRLSLFGNQPPVYNKCVSLGICLPQFYSWSWYWRMADFETP
jgi:hypothetical protein